MIVEAILVDVNEEASIMSSGISSTLANCCFIYKTTFKGCYSRRNKARLASLTVITNAHFRKASF